eukprot:XP_001707166.1 Hypothetical protein GL50803_34598 [Giardia lamblia ATCC 50803]
MYSTLCVHEELRDLFHVPQIYFNASSAVYDCEPTGSL